jgi:LPS sulfotransferase NodH
MRRAVRAIDGEQGALEPATRFVLLGHPRSGSTLLFTSLIEHPSLRIYGELFQDDSEARREAYGAPEVMYRPEMDGATFLDERVFREDGNPETLAVGFKLFYTQAREPFARTAWAYLLRQKDIRIVHLVRNEVLRSFASLCEAEASGEWHVDEGQTPVSSSPVRIDPERCLAFLDAWYAHREWVRQAFSKHEMLELSYERHILPDFQLALRDVQSFLGIPPLTLPVVLRRQGTRPLEERISNYDEIRSLLKHTVHDL